MKILAIDSSARAASAAVCEEERVLCESYADVGLTHSETLLPMLDAMLRFLSNAWALGGSAIVLAVLLGWLDWLMCRRIPVKG